MDQSTKVLAELLAMVRGRKAKKSVKDKVVVQQCIQCDQPAIIGCRGLCRFHYGQFKYARAEASKNVSLTRAEEKNGIKLADKVQEAKDAFDELHVKRGNILGSQQGKHGAANCFTDHHNNPFSATA